MADLLLHQRKCHQVVIHVLRDFFVVSVGHSLFLTHKLLSAYRARRESTRKVVVLPVGSVQQEDTHSQVPPFALRARQATIVWKELPRARPVRQESTVTSALVHVSYATQGNTPQ